MSEPLLRKKSPRAPSMSLEEAVERVQKVYERERLHPAPTEVVAQHLGYKGATNGAALSALASVRYFGLVDRPREGFLATTKDFEHFKFAPDESQRRDLLIRFLRKPSLYADLLDKYETGLPSDANLKFDLIQRGFNPATAEAVLVAFRRSVDFSGYFSESMTSSNTAITLDENQPAEASSSNEGKPRTPLLVTPQSLGSDASDLQLSTDEGSDRIPVRLPAGRRAWLVIPNPFFSGDKARLKAYIDLLLTEDEDENH